MLMILVVVSSEATHENVDNYYYLYAIEDVFLYFMMIQIHATLWIILTCIMDYC